MRKTVSRLTRKQRFAAAAVLVLALLAVAGAGSHTKRNHATSSSPAQSGQVLTGLGATRQEWNAHHKISPGYDKGTVYDPDRSVPGGNRYITVNVNTLNHIGNLITGYEMQLPNVPLSRAEVEMAAELPSDAKLVSLKTHPSCAFATYHSALLGKATGSQGSSYANFELGSGAAENTYNPRRIDDAIVLLGKPLTGIC